MFRKRPTQKLDARVRYQQPKFRRRLADARGFRRPVLSGFSAKLRVWWYLWRRRAWLLLTLTAVLGVLYVCAFVPGVFFINAITVSGGAEDVNSEVSQEVERYLKERVLLILPRRNLWFYGPKTLSAYITTINSNVWKVDEVKRIFPHGLSIRIVPRTAEFIYSSDGQDFIIANDGTVLPANTHEAGGLLRLVGPLIGQPIVGNRYVEGGTLQSLMALRSFSVVTGLPEPKFVELVPVTELTVVGEQQASPEAATVPHTSSSISEPELQRRVLSVPPDELKVSVPQSDRTPEFDIFLRVGDRTEEAFRKLRLLLAAQQEDRLKRLRYIDMRLDDKAFICLVDSACAP